MQQNRIIPLLLLKQTTQQNQTLLNKIMSTAQDEIES
jgi:hypothetical protein